MDALIEILQFVPNSGKNAKGFARMVAKELFPQVDMSPTRGGQILTQTLLQHPDGPLQWVIAYDSMGGSWYASNTRAARTALDSKAVVYGSSRWTVLNALTKPNSTAVRPFPVALSKSYSSYVRMIEIGRNRSGTSQSFEAAMSKDVLPNVRMQIRSRLGHTTSTALAKGPLGRKSNRDRYLWFVSRFAKIDHTSYTGEKDTTDALENLQKLGSVYGFVDLKVLHHQTAQA